MGAHLRQRVVLKNLERAMTIADLIEDHQARKRWRARLAEPAPPAPLANRKSRKGSRSAYLGVHWDSAARKWRAVWRYDGRTHYLGLHATEAEAARAYDAKVIEIFGDRAVTNFEQAATGQPQEPH